MLSSPAILTDCVFSGYDTFTSFLFHSRYLFYQHYCWWDIFWLQKDHNFKSSKNSIYYLPKATVKYKVPQQKSKKNCLIIYSMQLIQPVLSQNKRRGQWGNQMPNSKTQPSEDVPECGHKPSFYNSGWTLLTLLSFRNPTEHCFSPAVDSGGRN